MRLTLIAAAIVLALFAAVQLATGARAATPERVVDRQPIHCTYGVRCTQLRTVSTYTHGQPTLVVTQLRSRPAARPTWGHWHTVGAVVVPA
jgi:hypothetical protein